MSNYQALPATLLKSDVSPLAMQSVSILKFRLASPQLTQVCPSEFIECLLELQYYLKKIFYKIKLLTFLAYSKNIL